MVRISIFFTHRVTSLTRWFRYGLNKISFIVKAFSCSIKSYEVKMYNFADTRGHTLFIVYRMPVPAWPIYESFIRVSSNLMKEIATRIQGASICGAIFFQTTVTNSILMSKL